MCGAKVFNQQNNQPISPIFGCVTTGDEWLFMQMSDVLLIDTRKYFINELGELLAVFQHIIDQYRLPEA